MKKIFNLFSLIFTIVSIMVCIIFAFNCGGDDEPVDKPMSPVDEPMSPVDKPMSPVDKPMSPVDKPMSPVDEPMQPVPKPTACENPELAFPTCLPSSLVCDDPAATTDKALLGAGTADDPFVLCRPAHVSLLGTTSTYALDKHYILGKDIDLMDGGPSSIGGPCEDMSNAFTGSFDGRGKTISNIGFNSDKSVYAEIDKLFSCSDKMKDTNFSYISEDQVCGHIDGAELVREDNSMGPYIVCSRAHLNAIDAAAPGLLTDSYALYQDINLGTIAEGGDGGGNFTPITGSFTGTFDGQGKEIMNLIISVNDDAGLFLELGADGVIQNLGINNFNVATTKTSGSPADNVLVGSLVAVSLGAIANCYAIDSDEGTDVSGSSGDYDAVGGLVGVQNGGTIISSYATGSVDGGKGSFNYVGGLLGRQKSGGSIISSYAAGDASGGGGSSGGRVGGLVGNQSGGSIISSYCYRQCQCGWQW